jgi:hypothetical protein
MSASKAEAIIRCLAEEEVDLWRLRELALTEGGLLNNVIRRRAWPKLLGIDCFSDPQIVGKSNSAISSFESDRSGIPNEAEMDQVQRDVTRCTWHLLTHDQRRVWKGGMRRSGSFDENDAAMMDENSSLEPNSPSRRDKKRVAALLKRKQETLGHLINMILQEAQGSLTYYQGYHDVSSVCKWNSLRSFNTNGV